MFIRVHFSGRLLQMRSFERIANVRRARFLAVLLGTLLPACTRAQECGSLLDQFRSSIVFITAQKTMTQTGAVTSVFGTGFIASSDGIVLTNDHVITAVSSKGRRFDEVEIMASVGSRNAPKHLLKIVGEDSTNDIAVLQFVDPTLILKPVSIGNPAVVEIDNTLCSFGFPLNIDLFKTEGKLGGKSGPRGWWFSSIDSNYGESGAPVFDIRTRCVVAMKVGERDDATHISYLIPINSAFTIFREQMGRELINSETVCGKCPTAPSALYFSQRWSWWNGLGVPDTSSWTLPNEWEIKPLDNAVQLAAGVERRYALVMKGTKVGWPREFDHAALDDFILRFRVRFPEVKSFDGPLFAWLIRTQECGTHSDHSSHKSMDDVGGYQFWLRREGQELYLTGDAVQGAPPKRTPIDSKPLKLGLRCCTKLEDSDRLTTTEFTEYEVFVRAYHEHLDSCITITSPFDPNTERPYNPEAGHTGRAYFHDEKKAFVWGSIGFAVGEGVAQASVTDIEVFPLHKDSFPDHPEYYSETFRCQ